MAITTYSELQTAVQNWLDRTDLSSRVPEFIALAEAKFNRRLRVRQQLTTTSLSPSSGSASLPSDYLEWKRVTWEGSPQRELEYVEPTYLVQAYPDSPSDTPRFFTIEGANLKIGPVSSTSITLAYYEKIDALTDQATTNWLLTAHPDVYLFGALVEASAFGEGLDEAAAWAARLELGLNEVERLSQQSRGQAVIRAYGVTP
jgi:hypothetical protein